MAGESNGGGFDGANIFGFLANTGRVNECVAQVPDLYFQKCCRLGVMRLLTRGFDCAKTQDIETTRVACCVLRVAPVAENWEVHAHAEQSRLFLIVSNGSPGADG
jgi:hypothetical protein